MGSVGAQVGTPAAKEALAEALMAAAAHVSDSDSETLVSLLRLVESTLAAGLHEYTVRVYMLTLALPEPQRCNAIMCP